jgi:hypothetical protein
MAGFETALDRDNWCQSGWIGDRSKKLNRHTMETEQVMAPSLLAKIDANQERLVAKIGTEIKPIQDKTNANQEEMEARIDVNNEKF